MTKELVERLREPNRNQLPDWPEDLLTEAADEIDRLRKLMDGKTFVTDNEGAIDQLHAAVEMAQHLAATRLGEVEQLQQRLKRHEPVSLYNGHDIDWWKNEAEQLRTALQLLHHRASEELGGFHSLVTLAEEILEMVPAPEPSDGPHRAFLEMPEGYSGPVKISNPGASVAEVTVYKGDPEPFEQLCDGATPVRESTAEVVLPNTAESTASPVHPSQGASRDASSGERYTQEDLDASHERTRERLAKLKVE